MARSFNGRLAIALVGCSLGMPALAQAPLSTAGSPPFGYETVQEIASQLAAKPHEPASSALPKGGEALEYDQYRQIRFRRERSIWRGEGLGFEMQVLPTGWLFKAPIEINIVDEGGARPLAPDNSFFDLGPLAGKLPPEARFGFSGLRITGPLNRPDVFDEIIVFQGASYFRALSRGQIYGLSARGLALNVGKQGGEEFPFFQRFWVEKPKVGASQIIIHALLDSPSVTGAYRFQVVPGPISVVDVQSTLYPQSGTLHRARSAERETNKRKPPARIHSKLLPHLRRWHRQDMKYGITYVVHYLGAPIRKLRRAWASVGGGNDGPHICRHTAATWLMQGRVDIYEAAGYLGMTPETLWSTYGHHHPDYQRSALQRPANDGTRSQ